MQLTPVSTRRQFLKTVACGMAAGRMALAAPATAPSDSPYFTTRGVILLEEDLSLADWPERAKAAGLNTIALHAPLSPRKLAKFVQSDKGQQFLGQCRKQGHAVEYENHAMKDLLPRELYEKDRNLFRMNEKGERVGDYNFCVHSKQALEIVVQNAIEIAKILRPSTSRYFFWGDDGCPWCKCPKCSELTETDQALLVENRLIEALRKMDPKATLAHLAYANLLPPPKQIKPASGLFLEYAPIERRYDLPIESQNDPKNRRHLELLDANLELFGREDAQALEYWLDVSLFSKWKKPAVKLPFDAKIMAADLDTYGSRGIRRVTTFAAYIDADYVAKHGEPPLNEYGEQLTRWRPSKTTKS